jgi:hypothetical protein
MRRSVQVTAALPAGARSSFLLGDPDRRSSGEIPVFVGAILSGERAAPYRVPDV